MCCSYVCGESDNPAPSWRGNNWGDATEALRYAGTAQCGIVGEWQWETSLQRCGGTYIYGQKIQPIRKITSGFLDVLLPAHKHTNTIIKKCK